LNWRRWRLQSKVAFDKKKLPALAPEAMCYVLSKQGYLSDSDGRWHSMRSDSLDGIRARASGALRIREVLVGV